MGSLPQDKGVLLWAGQELSLRKGQGLAPVTLPDKPLFPNQTLAKQQLSGLLPYHR